MYVYLVMYYDELCDRALVVDVYRNEQDAKQSIKGKSDSYWVVQREVK